MRKGTDAHLAVHRPFLAQSRLGTRPFPLLETRCTSLHHPQFQWLPRAQVLCLPLPGLQRALASPP